MPIYRPLVPNGHSDSPQMISGSGLELSGGKFPLKDLAKGVGKAANVAIPLAQAFGVQGADQAAAVNNAIHGQGFGKGTQKKDASGGQERGQGCWPFNRRVWRRQDETEEKYRQKGSIDRFGVGRSGALSA